MDSNGCSDSQKDSDGDGVIDDIDECPNTANGESVNSNGCPNSQNNTDSDGDGVSDYQDNCPNTPYNTSVDSTGCATSSPIYLASNGVTIKCHDWAQVGQTGV